MAEVGTTEGMQPTQTLAENKHWWQRLFAKKPAPDSPTAPTAETPMAAAPTPMTPEPAAPPAPTPLKPAA